MPSQNLPKPNIPGLNSQTDQTDQPVQSSTQSAPQPVQAVIPTQIRQTQVIPGGLSRENPGGTPPNMRVAAPPLSAPQGNSSEPKAEQMASRPMSPLSQMSLKDMAPIENDKKPEPAIFTKPMTASTPTMTAEPTVQVNPETPKVEEAAKPKPKMPNPLASLKGKIPLPALIGVGVLILALVGILIFNLFGSKTKTTTKSTSGSSATSSATTQITTVTYWGLWEDSQILKQVIADFESKNPSIKIDYRKQSHQDYRERLQQAIDSGNGPDIFRYHVSWVPMLSTSLAAMPSSVMSLTEYKQIFYPVASTNLQVGGQIVGIPMMYDGLALFYNKEMLKTANLDVPTTWAELRTAANRLTVPSNLNERRSDNITRAGLAIGNAGNVDNFSDILALLIIQNGGNPANANSQYVKDAITFYTNFVKQDKVWSDRLANSTTAFARGDVAMILAPSWRVHEVKNLNPNLDFAVARVPQLDTENPASWATFWAEGVSAKSKNKDAAWAFLKYLSTPEVLRKFYNDASQYRAFGEVYPRTDMASELQSSELVGAYLADAPIAKSWYMSSFTHDNGLNDQIIKYYEDAINAVLSSTSVEKALETAATGVTSVISKYSSK
ncbi:MAG: hypothetical protein UT13_C0001G0016 [Candidatus Pacebacteria bacterium GW2011_GWF2_38_9]|nr:MAG: sugar transport system sugar-binding protein [candidate division TM6 bacterium GW2011_GWF2_28_16]KKQ08024.1 MAG: hypothetical protein US20_C0025G0002 [Candidatus Pacebacteria bacterium GW2011_GWF1_36_5]KKQ88370.1 MAG: hypothetical protein UT13_C0001G0016 [Candidatus Pacebacteria bacterium GW2011_GWF2_38_9]HAZ72987.1 hypothetical protein [Candidatus Paceibacterota bacterium]